MKKFDPPKAALLFVGLSIKTTPKIRLITTALEKQGFLAKLFCVVKLPEEYSGDSLIMPLGKWNSRLAKIFTGIFYHFALFLSLIKYKPTLIYAINPSAGAIAKLYSLIFGTKYIYETHEIFCGFANDIYGGRKRKLWHLLESNVIKGASAFVATDQFRLKFLRRYYRINREKKCHYVYNVSLQNNQHGFHDNSTDNRDTFRIVYAGGIYPDRQIETLIEAFSLLDNRFQLNLAGPGSDEYLSTLRSLILAKNLGERVIFHGILSEKEVRQLLVKSGVSIALYKRDCVNNRLASPNKYFEAIYCNVQIVGTYTHLAKYLFGGSPCFIKETTPHNLSEAIIFAAQQQFSFSTMRSLSFSDNALENYQQIISSI